MSNAGSAGNKWALVLPEGDTHIPVTLLSSNTGMPPIKNSATPYSLNHGAEFGRTQIQSRIIYLKVLFEGENFRDLLDERQQVIDVIKADRDANAGLVRLRFSGGREEIETYVVMDGGLELENITGHSEIATLRFLAPDPFFMSVDSGSSNLGLGLNVENANCIIQRDSDGMWSSMGQGVTTPASNEPYVEVIVRDNADNIYAGGYFSEIDGVAANNVAKWDGSNWSALGAGVNGKVYAMAIGLDGSIYVGGVISQAGGANATYIAKWDGSNWSALGTGITWLSGGGVYSIAVGLDGSIYVGGRFTTAGGITVNNIAKWDGESWSALGTGITFVGGGGGVLSIAIGLDGSLYAGGYFLTAGNITVNNFAKWDGESWSAVGTGMDAAVSTIAVGLNGTIYAGGSFTSVNGIATNYIGRLDGNNWSGLGSGIGGFGYVNQIAVDRDGNVYVVGSFGSVGGITVIDNVAVWNKTSWYPLEVTLPAAGIYLGKVLSTILVKEDSLWIGSTVMGTATTAKITLVNNAGTADTYPILGITGIGNLIWFANLTSNDRIYFDNLTLLSNETVTLDLSRLPHPGIDGKETNAITFISNKRGNMMGKIRSGSNIASFRLSPGNNKIGLLLSATDGNSQATLTWRKRYWSIDGVGVAHA